MKSCLKHSSIYENYGGVEPTWINIKPDNDTNQGNDKNQDNSKNENNNVIVKLLYINQQNNLMIL